ncbi:hypothetical protein ON010_g7160 [Phytophthora cinnamomi]|nr:hypothetical protein ON010_g7160 [Phytophthora cinnamomi]
MRGGRLGNVSAPPVACSATNLRAECPEPCKSLGLRDIHDRPWRPSWQVIPQFAIYWSDSTTTSSLANNNNQHHECVLRSAAAREAGPPRAEAPQLQDVHAEGAAPVRGQRAAAAPGRGRDQEGGGLRRVRHHHVERVDTEPVARVVPVLGVPGVPQPSGGGVDVPRRQVPGLVPVAARPGGGVLPQEGGPHVDVVDHGGGPQEQVQERADPPAALALAAAGVRGQPPGRHEEVGQSHGPVVAGTPGPGPGHEEDELDEEVRHDAEPGAAGAGGGGEGRGRHDREPAVHGVSGGRGGPRTRRGPAGPGDPAVQALVPPRVHLRVAAVPVPLPHVPRAGGTSRHDELRVPEEAGAMVARQLQGESAGARHRVN